MSNDRPKRETMTIEEAMTLNMLRLAALIEELEPSSVSTKQKQIGLGAIRQAGQRKSSRLKSER